MTKKPLGWGDAVGPWLVPQLQQALHEEVGPDVLGCG